MSIFEWRLANECGTSQSLVMTQIVFAIYYLLGVVLVQGAWVRGTRNFVESKTALNRRAATWVHISPCLK